MMQKILRIGSLCLVILSISACEFNSPLELIYYDREKFILDSVLEDDSDKNIFLCIKGKIEEETKKRANEANNYYSTQMELIVEEFADALMKNIEDGLEDTDGNTDKDGNLFGSIIDSMTLQKKAEKLALDVENKYQCLFIDVISSD